MWWSYGGYRPSFGSLLPHLGLWVSSLDEREKGSEVPIILRTERMWRKVSGLLAFLLCEEKGVGVILVMLELGRGRETH